MCGHSYFACTVCVGTCLAGGTVCVHVHPMGPLCRTMDTNMFKTCTVLGQATQGCRVGALYVLDHMASNRSQASVHGSVCVGVYAWSVLWECVSVWGV